MFRKLFSNDCMRSLSYVFAGAKCNATRPISSQMYPTKFKGYSTIYALSSGYGKCGVAVVRISGPEASRVLQKMTRISKLEPRKAFLRKIYDPETKEVLDKGLCLWFPEPHSFTGENSTELHVHGGPAVIASILSALSKLRLHPAAPGEFTRRAFLNGKLDLTEAEGIGDLIEAETEKQRKQASRQASGSLRKFYDSWRSTLVNCLASLEAYVDFSEEHGLETNILEESKIILRTLCTEIEKHLSDGRKGEILRNGVRVVILGEPNVGKSSLLNIFSGSDTAIVTSSPGTTRDIVELTIDVCGYPMILADTAGIRENPENEVEVEGIKRAKNRAETADLILCVLSVDKSEIKASKDFIEDYKSSLGLGKEDKVLVVLNKMDLIEETERQQWRMKNTVLISCKTQEGIQDLMERLKGSFEEICGNPSEEDPVISHARYRNHLSRTLEHLQAYFERTRIDDYDVAISLQDIRGAARELGKITGHVSNEEVLDVIFNKFCVGK